jgi:hypothetical protein
MNETQAFDRFDDELKLDPIERARAEKCHLEITAVLRGAGLIVLAFLQGSFARKTMISPLRDIDKVVIVAAAIRGLSPEEVMLRLEGALHAAYPNATFERTRHSLKVDFGNESFSFDVVPAHETTTDDDDVLIANCDSQGWDRSNTRELIRVVQRRNEECNGRFVHVVRMVKHLVAHRMDEVISGLHVESIAYAAVTTSIPYPEACLLALQTGAQLLGGSYTDPTGKDRISDRLTSDARATARAAFASAVAKAREARALADSGDVQNAVRVWHELFGAPFPEGKPQSVRGALAAATGGSVTSTGHVSTTSSGRQGAPPTRSWRAR